MEKRKTKTRACFKATSNCHISLSKQIFELSLVKIVDRESKWCNAR